MAERRRAVVQRFAEFALEQATVVRQLVLEVSTGERAIRHGLEHDAEGTAFDSSVSEEIRRQFDRAVSAYDFREIEKRL